MLICWSYSKSCISIIFQNFVIIHDFWQPLPTGTDIFKWFKKKCICENGCWRDLDVIDIWFNLQVFCFTPTHPHCLQSDFCIKNIYMYHNFLFLMVQIYFCSIISLCFCSVNVVILVLSISRSHTYLFWKKIKTFIWHH